MKIKNDAEYEAALAEIERLIDLDPDWGTSNGKRLDILTAALQVYERGIMGCKYCKDNEPHILDKDGVLSSVSGLPGRWAHATLDGHLGCEKPPSPDPDPVPYKFVVELIAEGKARPHNDPDCESGVFYEGLCSWCGAEAPDCQEDNPNQIGLVL